MQLKTTNCISLAVLKRHVAPSESVWVRLLPTPRILIVNNYVFVMNISLHYLLKIFVNLIPPYVPSLHRTSQSSPISTK